MKAKCNYSPRYTRKWQKVAGPVNLLWWARQPCWLREAESKPQGAAQPAQLCSWMAYSATLVGTQRSSARGDALCLATSSPRKQAIESHVNNTFGDYFYGRNLVWSNWIFALWCTNSPRGSTFSQKFLVLILHVLQRSLYRNILVLSYKWPNSLFPSHFNEAEWESLFTYTWPHKAAYLDLLFNLFWHAEFTWKEGGSCLFISSPKSQSHY